MKCSKCGAWWMRHVEVLDYIQNGFVTKKYECRKCGNTQVFHDRLGGL